jgi:D-threo-aldose 1-dehydrogenase
MAEICRTHGVALTAAALQFPRRRGGVASVLAGAHSAEQVREQQQAMSAPLPEDLWAELDARDHRRAPTRLAARAGRLRLADA